MRRLLILLAASYALANLTAEAAVVRVGIISLGEDPRAAADLLTAKLSAQTNLVLVERDEVDKAVRERGLAPGQRADLASLGETLRADGLVLLERVTTPVSTNLAVRLIAVSTGVVLDAAVYPLPLLQPTSWADLETSRLAPTFPKLAVKKGRAIPISLLNLHSATATPETAITERGLTTLLFHRLVLEPGIFVLERRQLGRAVFEKGLALDDKPFWSGGYLLEGVIEDEDRQRGTIRVSARLSSPNQGAPVALEVSGFTRDLPAIAAQLAQKILRAMGQNSVAPTWPRESEAERFEQEAAWALRWRMWPEAYAAAESAWALGRHSESVAAAQVNGLLEQLIPEDVWRYDYDRNVKFSNPRRHYDFVRDVAWTTNAPEPDDVPMAIEAAGLYGSQRGPETPWATNAAWLALGSNVLGKISGVIRHQYLYGWPSNDFHPDLPILRGMARDLAMLLPREQIRGLLMLEGPYWQETAADAVKLFRDAMRDGDFEAERTVIFSRDPYAPFWVGWRPIERETGRRVWDQFIAELLASTNSATQADGALIKLHGALFDSDVAMASELFLDAVVDQARARFRTNVAFSALDDYDQILKHKALHPVTLRRGRLMDAWRALEFARMKHYLQTARVHNIDRAGWPYAGHVFSQEQAKELLPVVDDYIKRIGGDWMQEVRRQLVRTAGRPTAQTNALAAAQPGLPHQAGTGPGSDASKAVAAAPTLAKLTSPADTATNLLKVTRLLRAMFQDARGELLPIGMGRWIEAEGKIITTGSHPMKGFVSPLPDEGTYVIEIDPMSGASRMLPQEIALDPGQTPTFQVIGDEFYWFHGGDKLGVIRRRSNAVREYPVNLPLRSAQLTAVGKRLFLTSADYIAEFERSERAVKLLASKRRKPPTTKLDDWPGWTASPKIWLGDNGALFANVGGTNIWTYAPTGDQWTQRLAGQGQASFPWTLAFSAHFAVCLDERVWIDGHRETLLSFERDKLPHWPMPFDYPLTPGRTFGTFAEHSFDGTNLFILLPAVELTASANTERMMPLKDRDTTLLWFSPEHEMPASIPLRFEARGGHSPAPSIREGTLHCTPTSQGLIFAGNGDHWLLPWSDLHDWARKHQPNERNLARSEPERRRKFDLNHDGTLDQQELRAMNSDVAWRVAQEKFESRRLLLTFDADQDEKLTLPELQRLVRFTERFGVQNSFSPSLRPDSAGKANEVLKACDANHNGSLEGAEIIVLYAKVCGTRGTRQPGPR
jgi:hypothetical protein